MQYMLMIYGDESGMANMTQKDGEQMSAAYAVYTQALLKAGAMVGGDRLHSSADASTVRVSGGKTKVLNGPYSESKEQLGGYYIIEAKDLDEAIAWAAKCPGAQTGTMEVRPVWKVTM
ncbi:YciI family protein [Aestuariivirga litoralis]|uniref:YciI family protein n=1 Tax=Aestuariivirga litoralis TaxID=2650924 RepID=UPI0018C4A0DA|nr:YciI family protein [Aestuariivirga litoralis]MBG1233120.1 YciI family protein [Aestuariivirga litoralis]